MVKTDHYLVINWLIVVKKDQRASKVIQNGRKLVKIDQKFIFNRLILAKRDLKLVKIDQNWPKMTTKVVINWFMKVKMVKN